MILSKSLGGLVSPFMNSKTKDIEIESGYEKQERLRKEEEKRKKELEDIRIAKEKMLIQEEEAKQKLAEKNGKSLIGKDGKPLSPTAAAKINAKKLKRAKRKLKRREEFDDTDSENSSSAGSSSSGSGDSGSDDGGAASTGPSRSQTPVSSHVPGSRSSTPVPFAATGAVTDSTGPTTSGTNPRSIYSEHPVTPISSLHSNKSHHHHNHHTRFPDPGISDPFGGVVWALLPLQTPFQRRVGRRGGGGCGVRGDEQYGNHREDLCRSRQTV